MNSKDLEKQRMDALKQRRKAAVQLVFGLGRTVAWLALIIAILVHAPWAVTLAKTILFVSIVSLYANAATDWGQVQASRAAVAAATSTLAALDARVDITHAQDEINRRILETAETIERHQQGE